MIVVSKMGTAEQVERLLKPLLKGMALLLSAEELSLYAQRLDVVVMEGSIDFYASIVIRFSQSLVFPGFSDLGRLRATPKLTFNMKLETNLYKSLVLG